MREWKSDGRTVSDRMEFLLKPGISVWAFSKMQDTRAGRIWTNLDVRPTRWSNLVARCPMPVLIILRNWRSGYDADGVLWKRAMWPRLLASACRRRRESSSFTREGKFPAKLPIPRRTRRATRWSISCFRHCICELLKRKSIQVRNRQPAVEKNLGPLQPRFGLPFSIKLRVHGSPPPEYLQPPDARWCDFQLRPR